MAGFASDSEASSIEEGGLAFARAPVLAAPAGDVREPPAGVPPEPAGADAAAAADAVPHGAPSAAGDGAPPGAEDDADASDLDEDSGSDSDCDAFDFRATAALGLKPAAFHEKGGVPTFRPSAAQFADFGAFIRAVEPWGRRRGLVKVVPPPEWFESLGDPQAYVPPRAARFAIKTPINQHFQGASGLYRQINVEDKKQRWSFESFASVALSDQHRPACMRAAGRRRRRETDSESDESSEDEDEAPRKRKPAPKKTAGKRGRPAKGSPKPADGDAEPVAVKREDSPTEAGADGSAAASTLPTPPREFDEKQGSPAPKAAPPKVHADLPAELLEQFAALDRVIDPDAVLELERDYWRNLTYVSPMYGADQLGTLFPKAFKHAWNLNGLDNLLSQTKVDLPGVTTPYIYVGMWKSTFAWHLEDMDLYSINYHHMGAPKHWYVVPPPHKDRFERVTRSTFPSDHKKCAEFMRHKSFVLSPKYLANQGIRVLKCVQRQGEFVITFPYSYHGGFNCGLNLAEAVNFATKAWIPIGKTAGFCRCISDSVRINMNALLDPNWKPEEPADAEDGSESDDSETERERARFERATRPVIPLDLKELPPGPLPPALFYRFSRPPIRILPKPAIKPPPAPVSGPPPGVQRQALPPQHAIAPRPTVARPLPHFPQFRPSGAIPRPLAYPPQNRQQPAAQAPFGQMGAQGAAWRLPAAIPPRPQTSLPPPSFFNPAVAQAPQPFASPNGAPYYPPIYAVPPQSEPPRAPYYAPQHTPFGQPQAPYGQQPHFGMAPGATMPVAPQMAWAGQQRQ